MTDQFLVSWAPLGVNVNSAALLTPLVLVQRFWVTDYWPIPPLSQHFYLSEK